MLSKIPAITEAIIQLNKLDAFGSSEGQFIGASGIEIICGELARSRNTIPMGRETYEQRLEHRRGANPAEGCAPEQRGKP